MKHFSSLSLILVDVLSPLISLIFINILFIYHSFLEVYFVNALLIGFVTFISSIIFNYYKDYFFTYLDKKIKILVLPWLISLFIQFIYLQANGMIINNFIVLFWLMIPIINLTIRYFYKQYFFKTSLNYRYISIIGDDYIFSSYEITRLNYMGYKIIFHNTLDNYIQTKDKKTNIVILNDQNINLSELSNESKLPNINGFFDIRYFLKNYLRKTYISDKENINFNYKKYSSESYFLKKTIDYFAILLLLPFLLILLLYSYVVLKNQSPGPLLFKQRRIGINGKAFTIYKIRTMHISKAESNNILFDDTRIFNFGEILRRYHLDELPQLLNVLKGDMHIIGPRAEWNKLEKEYSNAIPFYKLRNSVSPGITGWAQVMFRYGFDAYDAYEKLTYDLYYIENWSIWLEFEIILRTIVVILDKNRF